MPRLSQRTLRHTTWVCVSHTDSSGMKDKAKNRSARLEEHKGSFSTKKQKKTRRSPTSTPSDVESPTENNDSDDTSDNDSNDTRTEKDVPSKKRKAKNNSEELGGQNKKRMSSSSVKSRKRSSTTRNQTRYLDSSSDESDEVHKPNEESPKPSTGSALKKKVNTKTWTLTRKTQQLVNLMEINVFVTHFM